MPNSFTISDLALGSGHLGICPLPGRWGRYSDDLATIQKWRPSLVLSMTTADEMAAHGASSLKADLATGSIAWHHLPIRDFDAPDAETVARWTEVSSLAQHALSQGGKVLAHCKGGCGRSGMMLLRLMVEMGEDPDKALARLRHARPCAVETEAQMLWATQPAR
ncbi:Dual specificity phosphatase, catalytic domain [Aliiroseovarius sediminilitoris]|uniref:Dual specificity phosphatase, catalytic domain n=1 Tax=Aliiroseovarius sediminilitoris TaxID=1173584 RepID=A0A1I0QTG4_9RHOB|nr:protein-tyrosine phosphatase family protein [Aliiroseovarius sediminilitoris]SEW30900.1 Dual specificity phosphatase, catalytic domain [Aliiroseovarius sediminilitoris]